MGDTDAERKPAEGDTHDHACAAAKDRQTKTQVWVTAKLDPPNARRQRRWFVVTAWQGKRRSIVADMKKVGNGVWRATAPIPYGGTDWKATLRLQRGSAVLGLPLYLPKDSAIPVPKVQAEERPDDQPSSATRSCCSASRRRACRAS